MDLNKMTPRQLTAGLMRGDALEMKMGYSPEAAAGAAARRFEMSEQEHAELLAYAQGFADGLVEDGRQGLFPERQSDAVIELEDVLPDSEHRTG